MLRTIAVNLFLLSLIILPLANCSSKEEGNAESIDAVKLNSEAIQLMAMKQYDEAVEKLQQAIELEPEDNT
jgi:outer membrane protein assembly factor BamD (BamD/ComL family)